MAENVLVAFALTLLAGLATGVGSTLAFFTRSTNTRFLAASLGFSAGVMLFVSMIEIYPKAEAALTSAYGPKSGGWYTAIAFFAGMLITALIDFLVPGFENPHEAHCVEDMDRSDQNGKQAKNELYRMGVLSAVAIAIHNFPEGLATFVAALKDPQLGLSIAIAIAIHNIPEGIAVSVPIYHATGSRRRAFCLSFLSGLAEPLGALIGYFFLLRYFGDAVFGLLFAAVAGIMVFISLDELLPTAEKHGEHHLATGGVVSGMIVMALSLLLLR